MKLKKPSFQQKKNYSAKKYGLIAKAGSKIQKVDSPYGLLLNTLGCKIPELDPWDPSVAHLIELQSPLKCSDLPLFMKSQPGGSIQLNKTVLTDYYHLQENDINCTYQSFTRKHEELGNVRENDYIVGKEMILRFGVPLGEDYVAVRCPIRNQTFEQYFPLVRLRKEVEDERNLRSLPKPRLNVILAGIDSVSKLNFVRHFPRTRKFLKEKLFAYEMKGYTKVGDNTFPNLVPLLTGRTVEHYWNETMRNSFYFDSLDFIWKDYAKRGYRTFYAEDEPQTGTFNYLKRGFFDPPTDYYFRPLALALKSSNVKKYSKSHCLNGQIETDLIYDFLRDFVEGMGTRPFFAFAMVSTLTHDYLNNAGLADEPTVRLLEDLWSAGVLNDSALVLFSDHGLRFGAIRETYIGQFEERLPFMFIHFPTWFLDQNPEIAESLSTNQDRLVTLFDIHATMVHLLDLSLKKTSQEEYKSAKGSSLLNDISPNRTCEDAHIPVHFCPCQTFENVPVDNAYAAKVSKAVIDDINLQLKPFGNVCAVLEIDHMLDVKVTQVSDFQLSENGNAFRTKSMKHEVSSEVNFLITLVTNPNKAVYEATVRYNSNKDTYKVLDISRINMYGNQSICVESSRMKLFCYCVLQ